MSSNEMIRHAIQESNIPRAQKMSIFQRMRMTSAGGGGLGRYMPQQKHAAAGMAAVRQSGEALITGAILGAIQAESKTRSLDVVVGDPTKTHLKLPVDGLAAVVSTALQIGLAGEPGSQDAGNIAAAAWAILAFRKTDEMVTKKKAATATPTTGVHGDFGADPILVSAARNL